MVFYFFGLYLTRNLWGFSARPTHGNKFP